MKINKLRKSFPLLAVFALTVVLSIMASCGSSPSRKLTPDELLWNAARNNRLNETIALIQKGANVNFRGPSDTTPLHPASGFSDLELVKYLVEHGADIDAKNRIGNTPLIFAVQGSKFANAKYLIDKGANVNARITSGEGTGKSALTYAYEQGDMDIYDYLIAHGAREFEPRQVAQQSAATIPQTNVYVQPAAPTQSAPVQPRPSTPTLQTGTYAANRTNITMHLNLGQVIAYSGRDPVAFGTYKVSGNQLAVTFDARTPSTGAGAYLRGNTYIYTLTSNTTFSGNGEDWIRTGY